MKIGMWNGNEKIIKQQEMLIAIGLGNRVAKHNNIFNLLHACWFIKILSIFIKSNMTSNLQWNLW